VKFICLLSLLFAPLQLSTSLISCQINSHRNSFILLSFLFAVGAAVPCLPLSAVGVAVLCLYLGTPNSTISAHFIDLANCYLPWVCFLGVLIPHLGCCALSDLVTGVLCYSGSSNQSIGHPWLSWCVPWLLLPLGSQFLGLPCLLVVYNCSLRSPSWNQA